MDYLKRMSKIDMLLEMEVPSSALLTLLPLLLALLPLLPLPLLPLLPLPPLYLLC